MLIIFVRFSKKLLTYLLILIFYFYKFTYISSAVNNYVLWNKLETSCKYCTPHIGWESVLFWKCVTGHAMNTSYKKIFRHFLSHYRSAFYFNLAKQYLIWHDNFILIDCHSSSIGNIINFLLLIILSEFKFNFF